MRSRLVGVLRRLDPRTRDRQPTISEAAREEFARRFPEAWPRLVTTVDRRDGMWPGRERADEYFRIGASALAELQRALRLGGRRPAEVRAVLDFACGYGRVCRWLRAGFPQAWLCAVDIDDSALKAVSRLFGVETRKATDGAPPELPESFSLQWVGSLFTHVPAAVRERLLSWLAERLDPGGLLVFSTHGEHVAECMRRGERDFGLGVEEHAGLLADFTATGFGFRPYPRSPHYGITLARPGAVRGWIEGVGLEWLGTEERRWAGNHDVTVARRARR